MATVQNQAWFKVCQWQVSALLLLVVIAVFQSFVALYSVLFGAAVAIVPSVLFAYYAFRFGGATRVRKVLHSFYQGEALRFSSCLIGFAIVFNLPIELSFISFWTGFLVCLFVPILLAGSGQIKVQARNIQA